ncbi:MAG: Uma2 family endonuclease [Oscillospiraceae bacterium]|nr:Uma2 family endonuclease [Oscillospiraceae bacterium]
MQALPQSQPKKRVKKTRHPIPVKKTYTVEEWEQLPESPRYELYDGELLMFARPLTVHIRIEIALASEIYAYLKGKKCEVLPEPNLRLDARRQTVFEPDIVVVCDPAKVTDNYVVGAPDLVIEILSPSTAGRDRVLKLNAYKDAGVLEYWIVDPVHKTVEVFLWKETQVPFQYESTDKIKVGIFDDLEIDLKTIFRET